MGGVPVSFDALNSTTSVPAVPPAAAASIVGAEGGDDTTVVGELDEHAVPPRPLSAIA